MNGVESVEIEVVRLPHGRDLALPDYATAAAAGADLLAAIDREIELGPLERKIVPTGISAVQAADLQTSVNLALKIAILVTALVWTFACLGALWSLSRSRLRPLTA